jgi:hypothetical protein
MAGADAVGRVEGIVQHVRPDDADRQGTAAEAVSLLAAAERSPRLP